MPQLHALILAGGSGTRFWPWSRAARPKQFLALDGERTLLEHTLDRLEGLVPPEHRWILTRSDLLDSVQALLPKFPTDRIIVEPEGRDTGPALALGALTVRATDPEAQLLALPSDHHIADPAAFRAVVERARAALEDEDALYTFGITPTEPATGFGYIERGEPTGSSGVRRVLGFHEKPELRLAEEYVASGEHFWNAGIFLWGATTFLDELAEVAPDFRESLGALGRSLTGEPDPVSVAAAFRKLPKISIDYALLERSDRVRVVEAEFPWDDVGSWEAISRLRRSGLDPDGNLVDADGLTLDCRNTVALGQGGTTLVLLGVEDLLVVQSDDAILVCPRSRAQEVRKVVEELRRQGRTDLI
jgi:mannose-1-phosphate guanylyltransferase